MATLRQRRRRGSTAERGLSIVDWSKMFRPGAQVSYQGRRHQAFQLAGGAPGGAFYGANSVVFACEANRLLLFSEARFQFQQLRSGRPGDLFGTTDLEVLEHPWPGHHTRDLLALAELDVLRSGNSYWVHDSETGGLLRLEPSTVKVLTESAHDATITGNKVGERLLGYVVEGDKNQLTTYGPEEIAHYKPYPDPTNGFVGMSWLSPCLPDVDSDIALTDHKLTQLRNGASLSYVVTLDQALQFDDFERFVEKFRRDHEGVDNAGKTLFLGGGADVKTVGQTFESLTLKATQGAGETRIAACAGVPPVVVGLSEGLQGSSLNAGNYGMARRRLVDGTMRPLWGFFASSMSSLVNVPAGARLWYDDRDIPFLREDVTDQAAIIKEEMLTIESGVRAGFTPDSVVAAVLAGDFGRLEHTGLFSVQLQKPGLPQPL